MRYHNTGYGNVMTQHVTITFDYGNAMEGARRPPCRSPCRSSPRRFTPGAGAHSAMFDNVTQASLWNRAQLYGRRSREKLPTFNDAKVAGPTTRQRDGAKLSPYVSRHSTGVLFSDPDGSTAPEHMATWLGSLGYGYDPDRGAIPLNAPEAPKARRERPATAGQSAAPAVEPKRTDPAEAEAFARFGKAPAFRKAFTAGGKLRKGWRLEKGVPCWAEAVDQIRSQGVIRF